MIFIWFRPDIPFETRPSVKPEGRERGKAERAAGMGSGGLVGLGWPPLWHGCPAAGLFSFPAQWPFDRIAVKACSYLNICSMVIIDLVIDGHMLHEIAARSTGR